MADKSARTAIFKGLNRMPYIGDGEMRDMKNLSSDAYPYLTTRKGRVPYTFTITVNSPEGEAYIEADVLPAPSEAELGKIYKITTSAPNQMYVSGNFYSLKNGEWSKYTGDDYWLGRTKKTAVADGKVTLVSTDFILSAYSNKSKPAGHKASGDLITYNSSYCEGVENEFVWRRYKVKYLGENTDMFEQGKSYAYCVYVKAHWVEGIWENGYYRGSVKKMPEATVGGANGENYYYYRGEETEEFKPYTHYMCVVSGRVYWEECEDQYTAVTEMPENGGIVRYCDVSYGAPVKESVYVADVESNNGETFLYWRHSSNAENSVEVGYLPPVSGGKIYKYIGPITKGEFARCYLNTEYYDWKVVAHPKVKRVVTLKDYLDNYEGSGLKEILEIGTLNRELVALIRDNTGNAKLYYRQKLYGNIPNLTEEAGKKLVMVGNRLVVGESGSYIHVKDGDTEFMRMADTFSLTVRAEKQNYGGNFTAKDRTVYSSASGNSNRVEFILYGDIYRPGKGEVNPNGMLEKLAEALSKPGMGFVAYGSRSENARKQYLKLTSVEFEKEDFLLGYPDHEEYNEYTSTLIIKAEGVEESFDWNIEERYDDITFESTDPHYYDVVAWKKRLWGYQANVFYGTVQDIWDSEGVVDWNTGNNTYTEAISQPLWQGGNITGIAALMNGLVFLKEDSITMVQGNYPAVLSSNTIPCRGLPPENRRSVAVGNEAVYYLGRNGVMRFDGGIPRCISKEAKINGTKAVGFSDGEKYYLSLKEADGKYALYVYDITYGLWYKEDDIKVSSFAVLDGCMHIASGTEIYNLNGPKEDVEWECELWYDEGTHQRKKYKQIDIRGDVGECELWLKADDDEWRYIGVPHKGSIKLIPFDCVELSLKLKGKGKCEIKSIDRTYEIVE